MSTRETQISYPLFDAIRTRREDPVSSHVAEARIRHSGTLAGQQRIVAELVAEYPGRNAHQLEQLTTLKHQQICRRLPECHLWQIQCGTFDSIWFPYCDCGPWCSHIRAEELVRQYKRIRITDPGRRKAEYRLENGAIELKTSEKIWTRAVIREAA